MTNLESELRELAAFVELPAERNLAPAVRARLGERRPRRRRALVLAFALVAVALGIAFAVPPARSAILRWLGIGNARIEFVDRLPDVEPRDSVDLGTRTSLGDARDRVSYHVLTSPLLGSPDEVRMLGDQIAFVYGDKLVALQTRGMFFSKEIGPGTDVQQFSVNGQPAVWISGDPHFMGYIGASGRPRPIVRYLAGNVLIWQHDELTLRLEGKLTRDEAVRLARSFG